MLCALRQSAPRSLPSLRCLSPFMLGRVRPESGRVFGERGPGRPCGGSGATGARPPWPPPGSGIASAKPPRACPIPATARASARPSPAAASCALATVFFQAPSCRESQHPMQEHASRSNGHTLCGVQASLSYVREVPESRNPDWIREPLFPCRGWCKPPLRQGSDPCLPQRREGAGGAWPGPAGGDGSDRPVPWPCEPCGSLVGPSQQFLCALNGSVGTDPHRKRTGTQECPLAIERKGTRP